MFVIMAGLPGRCEKTNQCLSLAKPAPCASSLWRPHAGAILTLSSRERVQAGILPLLRASAMDERLLGGVVSALRRKECSNGCECVAVLCTPIASRDWLSGFNHSSIFSLILSDTDCARSR
jgi:hypothetical protein